MCLTGVRVGELGGMKWSDIDFKKKVVHVRRSLYKSRLSPEKIAEKAEVYFCFSNHAKIVMTNNIAYIGCLLYTSDAADEL